jgi:hypothetical protein
MSDQVLTKRVRVAILLGVLIALSSLVAALVIFVQEDDWPVRFVSAGFTILAV